MELLERRGGARLGVIEAPRPREEEILCHLGAIVDLNLSHPFGSRWPWPHWFGRCRHFRPWRNRGPRPGNLVGSPDPAADSQGWHRLEASWVAERILIATPVPVSASELFDGDEIDVPAIVHVKIDALDPLLQGMPLDKIADGMIEEHSTRLKEAQLEFEVLARGERRTGGRPSVAVTTRQDSTINHALFVRTQGYLYEVTLAYELEHAAVYEGLADQIFDGVELKSIDAGSISMEPRETLLARLAAPRGWHEHTVEGGLPQVVISKEKTAEHRRTIPNRHLSPQDLPSTARPSTYPDSATLDDVYGLWLQSYCVGDGRRAVSAAPGGWRSSSTRASRF